MTITELEQYFKNKELPKTLQVDRGTKITDVAKMVESHFLVINSYRGSKVAEPFIARLIQLKDILEGEKTV